MKNRLIVSSRCSLTRSDGSGADRLTCKLAVVTKFELVIPLPPWRVESTAMRLEPCREQERIAAEASNIRRTT